MPAPDILHFLHIQDFLRDWVASQPETSETELLRWMGERVELSREQVRNLIYEEGTSSSPTRSHASRACSASMIGGASTCAA